MNAYWNVLKISEYSQISEKKLEHFRAFVFCIKIALNCHDKIIEYICKRHAFISVNLNNDIVLPQYANFRNISPAVLINEWPQPSCANSKGFCDTKNTYIYIDI